MNQESLFPQDTNFSPTTEFPNIRAKIIGVGSCTPPRVVSNNDLAKTVDTNDEWIKTRTGIEARRISDEATATSDLAIIAAEKAI